MLPIWNIFVQRRASAAQALAAKRKTKSRSQKSQCYRAFEKETIGMVYNPKICPEIYEDGLVSGDRWEVRQCFQKVFIILVVKFDFLQDFFSAGQGAILKILRRLRRKGKEGKGGRSGSRKRKVVVFLNFETFLRCFKSLLWTRIWRLKSKVDGVWLRKWPGKRGTWISWPA